MHLSLFFFQAEDGIRDLTVTGVQTCALPIYALLHVGIAGARGLPVPTLVIGSEAVYEDAHSPLVPARVKPDQHLLAAARRALPDPRVLPIGTSAHLGGADAGGVRAVGGFALLPAAAPAGRPPGQGRRVPK